MQIRRSRPLHLLLALFPLATLGLGCTGTADSTITTGADTGVQTRDGSSERSDQGIQIVCTTAMVADMLKNVVGDYAHIQFLMGEGVDPQHGPGPRRK